jgi:hypothetical protein
VRCAIFRNFAARVKPPVSGHAQTTEHGLPLAIKESGRPL